MQNTTSVLLLKFIVFIFKDPDFAFEFILFS